MRYFIAKYYKQPSGKINEQCKMDTKVRNRDLTEASVILDYKERKVVKSSFGAELGEGKNRDFETINNFYKQHYKGMISTMEAKYEVVDLALEAAKEILAEADQAEAAAKIEEIAKKETTNAKSDS